MKKINQLEKVIKVNFKNKRLLTTAITHPSYLNENQSINESYQRLEFLGDAVLELIVSHYLFIRFPNTREGRLTEIRAALVRTENLAKCARKIDLGDYILLSKGERINKGHNNINILADTLESVIGAIYIDKGFNKANYFFQSFIQEELNNILVKKLYIDPKTKLQEIIQNQYKTTPTYKVLTENKEGTKTEFSIGVYFKKKLMGKGIGKNKKIAEQQAAIDALGNLTSI